jgi:hypothetical protein
MPPYVTPAASPWGPPLLRRASNRRGEIRRSVYFGCSVRRAVSRRLVGDRSVDVSPKGLLLLSDERMERDAELVVSFRATELGIWFEAQATVARVVEGRRPGDVGRALGLEFKTLPAVSRLILRGHLRKIPPVLPKRCQPRPSAPTGPFCQFPGFAIVAAPFAIAGPEPSDPDYGLIVRNILEGRD